MLSNEFIFIALMYEARTGSFLLYRTRGGLLPQRLATPAGGKSLTSTPTCTNVAPLLETLTLKGKCATVNAA